MARSLRASVTIGLRFDMITHILIYKSRDGDEYYRTAGSYDEAKAYALREIVHTVVGIYELVRVNTP